MILAYQDRKKQITQQVQFFEIFFTLGSLPEHQQASVLEHLVKEELFPTPQTTSLLEHFGAFLYDFIHTDEMLYLKKCQAVIDCNGKYGSNYHPDRCYYNSKGQLILQ